MTATTGFKKFTRIQCVPLVLNYYRVGCAYVCVALYLELTILLKEKSYCFFLK